MVALDNMHILLLGASLILISMFSGKIASRIGLSHLLVTLTIGLLLGNGGRYDVDYDHPQLTLHISELALAFIIFGGGFKTNIDRIRGYIWRGLGLSTFGVLITTFALAGIIYLVSGWDFRYALLLGAIVSSTDAAAVFSILNNSGLKLRNGLSETLELESGTNDPLAYLLTVGISSIIMQPNLSAGALTFDLLQSIVLGAASGLFFGKLLVWVIKKSALKNGQNPILIICFIVIIYALNSMLGGSGFLALYIAGIWVGNAKLPNRKFNVNFQETVSWMMESVLFLLLGLQVYLDDIGDVIWQGLFISALLMFVARPVAVMFCTAFIKGADWRDRVFLSWVGLRGATPIVFALIPVVMAVPGVERLFNIAFIVVVTSVVFQGASLAPLARFLGLTKDSARA